MFSDICLMARTISISNFKGGVGKTTSTLNIGAQMAVLGHKVLLIDLDPQFNLTNSLTSLESNCVNTYTILCKGAKPEPKQVKENLFLIPSSLDLIRAEIELTSKIHREYILKKALKSLEKNFDFILIDCSPTLGNLTLNAYFASNQIFVPVESEFLSFGGYRVLESALSDIGIEIDHIFLTRYDRRKILNRTVKEAILSNPKAFKTIIRSNIALAEAPAKKQSIFEYSPKSNGAKDYKKLTQEILKYNG